MLRRSILQGLGVIAAMPALPQQPDHPEHWLYPALSAADPDPFMQNASLLASGQITLRSKAPFDHFSTIFIRKL